MADPIGPEPQAAISLALKALSATIAVVTPFLPGLAGALFSLAFIEQLTARGKLVAVGVGLASAIFLGPALSEVADLIWPGDMPDRVEAGIEFLVGLSAMGCLPPLLAWVKRLAGDPLSLLKVRIGPPPPAQGEGQ